MSDLRQKWIDWCNQNPNDKIDWIEFLEEHQQ